MSEFIVVSRQDAIATVTINNIKRRNALNRAAWKALTEKVSDISNDDSLRCVVLRGAGDEAFAAGADISEFPTERANSAQASIYGSETATALRTLMWCPHPTVAMIQGACTGGGLEIACCCDIRICNESARFGIPINRIGHPFAYPELEPVLHVAGRAAVLELTLEGRIVDAKWAVSRGLVNRVVSDDKLEKEILNTAINIANGAPLSVRGTKKFVNRLMFGSTPLSDVEIEESYAACDSEDYAEGVDAFLAKRKPVFNCR